MARHPHGMAMASEGDDREQPEQQARSPGAERVRRHRKRRADGYTSLRVDVNAKTLVWLADNGWMSEDEKLDRARLSLVLSDVLFCLGEGTLIANADKL